MRLAMRYYLLLLLTILTVGCASTGTQIRRAQKVESALVVKKKEITKYESAYVDAIVKSLSRIPKEKATKESDLALKLAVDTQKIVGLPEPNLVIKVDPLLSDDKTERVKAEADLAVKNAHVDTLLVEKNKLEEELQVTKDKIVEYAEKKYAEEKKNLFSSIWKWGLGTFGLIGTIALCIFFPGLLPVVISAVKSIGNSLIALLPRKNT